MRERTIAVIGAGNMGTAPGIMASLARWYPDFPFSIKLFDANPERLDLVDLLLRQVLDTWNDEIGAQSHQDLNTVLDGATDIIITLHEDCARRMLSVGHSQFLDYFEEASELDQYLGGDRNKPTPVDQLSDQTRRLLTTPRLEDLSAQDAMEQAYHQILDLISAKIRIVTIGNEVPPYNNKKIDYLSWPDSEFELTTIPHRILRWVRGDEEMQVLAKIADQSPLSQWLKMSESQDTRFS